MNTGYWTLKITYRHWTGHTWQNLWFFKPQIVPLKHFQCVPNLHSCMFQSYDWQSYHLRWQGWPRSSCGQQLQGATLYRSFTILYNVQCTVYIHMVLWHWQLTLYCDTEILLWHWHCTVTLNSTVTLTLYFDTDSVVDTDSVLFCKMNSCIPRRQGFGFSLWTLQQTLKQTPMFW